MRRSDLSGQTFGNWTVLLYAGKSQWSCECSCGTISKIRGSDLIAGHSTKCAHCRRRTHGKTNTRLYKIWKGMKVRCLRTEHKSFANYGGRGITVCQEWLDDPIAFMAWAERAGYDDHLTLDRIDNDGNYEPSNCRWAIHKQQHRNKSRNKPFLFKGKRVFIPDLARVHGLRPNTLYNRIKNGWPIERALTTPARPKRAAATLKGEGHE